MQSSSQVVTINKPSSSFVLCVEAGCSSVAQPTVFSKHTSKRPGGVRHLAALMTQWSMSLRHGTAWSPPSPPPHCVLLSTQLRVRQLTVRYLPVSARFSAHTERQNENHGRRHGGSRVGKRPPWKKSGWAWPTLEILSVV